VRSEIKELIKDDRHLTELCDAYAAARTAAEYWMNSRSDIGPARAREYLLIAAEVAEDIFGSFATVPH
jgi:hypothetical protein